VGVFRFGDCEIDFDRAEVKRSGQRVEITAQELRLLAALVRNRGHVLSRDQLIEAAWGRGIAITERAVDSHIFNLRKKVELVPSQPKFIVGVRGLGYRFEDEN
jgi:two-component system alkaline phosphatase synthesis response regulator PhoP